MGWSNLALIQPEGEGIPVFCVHGDEGNKLIPKYLEPARPFYAFFHQGSHGHRIELDRVRKIAREFIRGVKLVRPEGPYVLCGYSFGGVVAYEIAQQLTAAGDEVPVLALFDTYSPEVHTRAMAEDLHFYDPLKKVVMRTLVKWRLWRGLPLKGKLRHFHIIDTYDLAVLAYPVVPYRGKLTVFRAQDAWGPSDMGWDNLASGGLEVVEVPGDHYSMIREPNVAILAKELALRIAAFEFVPAKVVP